MPRPIRFKALLAERHEFHGGTHNMQTMKSHEMEKPLDSAKGGFRGKKKPGITYMTSKTLAGGFKWSRCKAGLCIFYRVFSETL